MTHERKWFLAIAFAVFVLLVGASIIIFRPPLGAIHEAIKKDYESVSHISAFEFSMLNPTEVIVFDVREPEEFDVSHIEGAIQIMPNIEPNEFIEDYGDQLSGKKVVFYCSVGRRSSELASSLGRAPLDYGAQSSLNLTGGVFSWANQGRSLVSSTFNKTSKVHPYNKYWGRLVEDQSTLSYTPD